MDYLSLIKRPMDLGTISKNIQNEQYKFVEQVLNDIQLVWDNCKSYNHSDSVHHSRDSTSTRWLTKWNDTTRS